MLKHLNTSQPRIIDLCTKYSMQSIAGTAEELRTEGCAYWMETHRDECPTGTDLGALGFAGLEELEFALAHYQDKCFEEPRQERMAWIASLNGEYLGRWGIEGFYFPSIVPTWTVAGPEKKEDKRV